MGLQKRGHVEEELDEQGQAFITFGGTDGGQATMTEALRGVALMRKERVTLTKAVVKSGGARTTGKVTRKRSSRLVNRLVNPRLFNAVARWVHALDSRVDVSEVDVLGEREGYWDLKYGMDGLTAALTVVVGVRLRGLSVEADRKDIEWLAYANRKTATEELLDAWDDGEVLRCWAIASSGLKLPKAVRLLRDGILEG